MAEQGLPTRQATGDNLAASNAVNPVTLPSTNPRVMQPAPINPPRTMAGEVSRQLTGWLTKKVEDSAKKEYERSVMDGQMAHAQGTTFEELETTGDKWSLEGYRLVEAQNLSSEMLIAQQNDIRTGAYEQDPDRYREQYIERVEAVVANAPDERTANLAREQMMKQMPVLAEQQMVQNVEYKERRNFETLTSSIHTISQDPTATDQLISFARGDEGSATAGLSYERRREATVQGVVRAFENDNPMAYSTLANEGLLGDNLTTEQQNQVKAAKARFEQRRRSQYDEEFFQAEQQLMTSVENGELQPNQAVEELSLLYEERGIEMTRQEAGAIYNESENGVRTAEQTNAIYIEEARMRGDYNAVAELSIDAVIHHESRGNPDAMGPVIQGGANKGDRAVGLLQVMPVTARNPGFGIKPIQNESKAEYERVGREYWAKMVERYDGNIEAAAIAYNAGPGNADKWVASGGDYSVLPDRAQTEPYAKGIAEMAGGQRLATPQQKLARAQATMEQTRQRTAMDTFEATEPLLQDIDNQFLAGGMTREDYLDQRGAVYEEYGRARMKADVNHEMGITQQAYTAAQTEAANMEEFAGRVELDTVQREFEVVVQQLENGEISADQAQPLLNAAIARRQEVMQQFGIELAPAAEAGVVDKMVRSMDTAIPKSFEASQNRVLVDEAIQTGTLGQLPSKLKDGAVQRQQQQTMQAVQQAVASGELPAEQAEQVFEQEMASFYAKSGVVDDRLSRVITGSLRQNWLGKDGQPNPYTVDALNTFRTIYNENPEIATSYIKDKVMRDRAIAAINRAGGGDLTQIVGGMGTAGDVPSYFTNASEAATDPAVLAAARAKAKYYIDETIPTGLHGLVSRRADVGQAWNRTNRQIDALRGGGNMFDSQQVDFENSEAAQAFAGAVAKETENVMMASPGLAPDEAADVAAETINRRGAFVGQDFLMLPDGQSLKDRFFGAEANQIDTVDPINTAINQYLTSDEAKERYPFIDDVSLFDVVGWGKTGDQMTIGDARDVFTTGTRPWRARILPNGRVGIDVVDGRGGYHDPIVLDESAIGQSFLRDFKSTR